MLVCYDNYSVFIIYKDALLKSGVYAHKVFNKKVRKCTEEWPINDKIRILNIIIESKSQTCWPYQPCYGSKDQVLTVVQWSQWSSRRWWWCVKELENCTDPTASYGKETASQENCLVCTKSGEKKGKFKGSGFFPGASIYVHLGRLLIVWKTLPHKIIVSACTSFKFATQVRDGFRDMNCSSCGNSESSEKGCRNCILPLVLMITSEKSLAFQIALQLGPRRIVAVVIGSRPHPCCRSAVLTSTSSKFWGCNCSTCEHQQQRTARGFRTHVYTSTLTRTRTQHHRNDCTKPAAWWNAKGMYGARRDFDDFGCFDIGCSDFGCSDLSHFSFLKILAILLNIHNFGTHLAHTQIEWNWQNRTFWHCFTWISTY